MPGIRPKHTGAVALDLSPSAFLFALPGLNLSVSQPASRWIYILGHQEKEVISNNAPCGRPGEEEEDSGYLVCLSHRERMPCIWSER